MNKDIFARSIGLLGEDNFNKIQNKVIAVFGLFITLIKLIQAI